MKRISYTPLHYGMPYIAWAIRSVQDAVDEIHILYSDQPSFGHTTDALCPESEEDLKREANRFARKPVIWHRGRWKTEGAHRDSVLAIAKDRGAGLVLSVDADEIWDPRSLAAALEQAATRPERIYRVPFVHFWRSFRWICRDGAWPLRIMNLSRPDGHDGYIDRQECPVFHFGYALPESLVRYKWRIHGHLGELRGRWFEEKFQAWKPGENDVHPTCKEGYWNPEPTPPDMLLRLEPLLSDHPYWGMEIVR